MYNETDYLTVDVLNYIESRMKKLEKKFSDYIGKEYTSKIWISNEFVYVDDIANIENYIEAVGQHFYYPQGWEKSRTWNLTGDNNISYRDINRWLKNIDILLAYETNPLVPGETLYPRGNYLYPNTVIYPETSLYSITGDVLIPTDRKEM